MQGDPRHQVDTPGVRATLEANRAQLDLMRSRLLGKVPAPVPAPSSAARQGSTGSASPAKSTLGGGRAGAGPLLDRLTQDNPVYGEAQTPLPRKLAQDYAPRYADAIRATPAHLMSAGEGLPPVGDLFTPHPVVPALPRGAVSPPMPSGWVQQRPYLTGYFLVEAAAAQAKQTPAQLDIYPPEVQESLLVDGLLSAFMGLSGEFVCATLADAPEGPTLRFRITTNGQVEPALQEMAGRLLPVCEYAAVVERWVETRDDPRWGLVAQALAGALRALLQDWHVMVAQLEHQAHEGRLTLQALWYYVQPALEALRCVAGLCAEAAAGKLRGGALLDLTHARARAGMGDARAHALLARLARAAAAPYFAVLARWVGEGVLVDPYAEFLVQEDASVRQGTLTPEGQSAFWHDRWTLRTLPSRGDAASPGSDARSPRSAVDAPVCLSSAQADILDAGKYLNVIRSCGQALPEGVLDPEAPLGKWECREWDESGRYLRVLARARAVAAHAAMCVLRGDARLSAGLGVLKRYFLTAQGDLFSHLMDSAGAEFGRAAGAVPLLQLQSLLSAAVRGSSAADDPAAAGLQAAFDTRSILNMLVSITQNAAATTGNAGMPGSPMRRGLKPVTPAPMTASERQTVGRQRSAREAFMLAYTVPWPLSIVAPEACVAQYQMVFRHLFELKWVERELNRVWQLHLQTRSLANAQSRIARGPAGSRGSAASHRGLVRSASGAALARSCAVCQLATHFFRQYLLYITFEVLEPLWIAFQDRVQTLDSLDEVLEQHRAFLKRVMKGCLLSRKVVLLRSLLALKDLALQFVKVSDRVLGALAEAGEEEMEAVFSGPGRRGSLATESSLWEERAERASRRCGALDATLSQPVFMSTVSTLYSRCVERVGEFRGHLAEAHRAAASERSDTREDLESLLNLQQRLDFNSFFPEPRARPAPARV